MEYSRTTPDNPRYLKSKLFKTMKSSNQDKAEGAGKEIKGKIKEAAGKVVGNEKLEAKGQVDQADGAVQKKVGDIKKVFGK
jgi:uncharacterized protein YjbJ (UPF0337 family)